ncbi:mCG1050997 [Mus musculus]|nr:mCG1050997 [Mus musculus]
MHVCVRVLDSPRTGVTESCVSCYMGARNIAQVLWKSSQCS